MEKFAAGNCDDLPESRDRALTRQVLSYPGDANLKKRKQISGTLEELNEPAAKHKCSEVITGSKSDELEMNVLASKEAINTDIMDVTDNSTQDSNSSRGNSPSLRGGDLYVETCASRSDVLSGESRLDGSIVSSVCHENEEIVNSHEGVYARQNNGFPDIHCLDECFDADYMAKQQTGKGLEQFIAATGVDRSMFMKPSEKWGLSEAEVQVDKQKPTIDQEFEEYFAMLML